MKGTGTRWRWHKKNKSEPSLTPRLREGFAPGLLPQPVKGRGGAGKGGARARGS